VTVTGSPGGLLYDARRDVYYARPVLRGWLHLLCFGASLAGGALLLARAHEAKQITAAAVYSASLGALFGTSALYHRGTWAPAWRRRLQRLDQAMIFFLIAGTATPVFLLAAPAGFGLACLIMMWVLTLAAAAVRLVWTSVPELAAGAVFTGLCGRPRAAVGMGPRRRRVRGPAARRRRALHRRGAFLSSSLARPVPVGVRLPRGLSCLCLCRCGLPVRRDSAVHRLNWRDGPGWQGTSVRRRVTVPGHAGRAASGSIRAPR
jgi:Haemolysin-III related